LPTGAERFAGQVVFPVCNAEGGLVSLCGCSAADHNETVLPDRDPGLWNAGALRTFPEILLTSTILDALTLGMAGCLNAVARPGPTWFEDADLIALHDHGVQRSPEDVIRVTSLTGKALFYKDDLSLKHRILALEEGEGAEEAMYAIRNLISAKELTIESATRDPTTGRLTTTSNRVRGPTTVFLTTTDPQTDPETRSRFILIGVNESIEQTRTILEQQRRRYSLKGLVRSQAAEQAIARHRNFQRLLRPLAIVNPFADDLVYADYRLQARRDQPKYLNLINAVAFLRQLQKQIKSTQSNGRDMQYAEVDREDLRIANDVAAETLARNLDELSMPSRNLLELIGQMVNERATTGETTRAETVTFTRRDIRRHSGWSNYRVHVHLRELVDLEYVIVHAGGRGPGYRYHLGCGIDADSDHRPNVLGQLNQPEC